MAGVQQTEHVYFYAVATADDQTREQYLSKARELAKTF
jgi:putative NADPH-quinone reductase